jgi:hypothetical protein
MSRTNFTRGICRRAFRWQLAPSPSGVASSSRDSNSGSLSALRTSAVLARGPVHFGFRSFPLSPALKLCRFVGPLSLADQVAYELANQGSIRDSSPTAISGHARGHTVRPGPQPERLESLRELPPGQRRPGFAPANVRDDAQFEGRHPVEVHRVVFHLPGRGRRTEIILLTHQLPVRLPAIG